MNRINILLVLLILSVNFGWGQAGSTNQIQESSHPFQLKKSYLHECERLNSNALNINTRGLIKQTLDSVQIRRVNKITGVFEPSTVQYFNYNNQGLPIQILSYGMVNSIPDTLPPGPVLTAYDACDNNVTVGYSETIKNGNCPDSKEIIRTWTATDHCGNVTTEVQKITIGDVTPPTLSSTPLDITVSCSAIPSIPNVTATDDYAQNILVSIQDVATPGACTDSYMITRTFIASDFCNNVTIHTQVITIQDSIKPILIGIPADITANCNNTSVPSPPTVSAIDNCTKNVQITFTEKSQNGNCPGSKLITRIWTAKDNCGNTSSATQIITLGDPMGPVLIGVPKDMTIECDSSIAPALVAVEDVCDPNPQLMYSEEKINGLCLDAYVLLRTWTATDICNNVTIITQQIKVQDTEPPTFLGFPADTTNCNIFPIPDVANLFATDNCDGTVKIGFSESSSNGNCPGSMVIKRTWHAVDNCSNVTTGVQTISIGDVIAPVFTINPKDTIIQCNKGIPVTTVTVKDNCTSSVPVIYSEVKLAGPCNQSYGLLSSWKATDACGNSTTITQKVTIIDTIPPIINNVPSNIIGNVNLAWKGTKNRLYAYDASGHITSLTDFEWNAAQQSWFKKYHADYILNPNGTISSFLDTTWNSSTLNNFLAQKNMLNYNTGGKLTSWLTEDWDNTNGKYVNTNKEDYAYDGQGSEISKELFQWDDINQKWIPDSKKTSMYAGKNITEITFFSWNAGTISYIPLKQETFSYNNNQLNSHITKKWNISNQSYTNLFSNQYTYTPMGQLSEEKKFTWNESLAKWAGDTYNKYEYLPNSNLNKKSLYRWDANTSNWFLQGHEENMYNSNYSHDDLSLPDDYASDTLNFNQELFHQDIFNYNSISKTSKKIEQKVYSWSEFTSGILDEALFKGPNLYPNPANNACIIQHGLVQPQQEIVFYESEGRQSYRFRIQEGNSIDITALPIGYYVYSIITSQGLLRGKLIKQ